MKVYKDLTCINFKTSPEAKTVYLCRPRTTIFMTFMLRFHLKNKVLPGSLKLLIITGKLLSNRVIIQSNYPTTYGIKKKH